MKYDNDKVDFTISGGATRHFTVLHLHYLSIAHTVEVEHLHLAQFGLAGPTLALKVEGACHTLSATQLSEVALRHTCTESNQEKVHT